MNTSVLIFNAEMLLAAGKRSGWLHVVGSKIETIGEGAPPAVAVDRCYDAGRCYVLPGFIDLHVHGIAGFDTMDCRKKSLAGMAKVFARHGVTAFLPTTLTASAEKTLAALETIAACAGSQSDGATILGAHLEGPYLNAEKCGAQNGQYIRRAGRHEASAWLDVEVIRLLALAPEFGENHWLIEECVRRSVTVSAAHTNANFAQMQTAVQLGVRQTTHTFNAMTGLHHREPGGVGAAMLLPELRCELIADNEHVHPAAMAILYRLKGPDGIILISDAVSAAGLPDGGYSVGGLPVVLKQGLVRLHDGTLAGSTLTMERALHNLVMATGESLEKVWPASSFNAARAIGISDRKGSLAVGKDADIVVLDEALNVEMTMAEGRIVYVRKHGGG